jgi:tetratricopeptide (TPR) repeat protein
MIHRLGILLFAVVAAAWPAPARAQSTAAPQQQTAALPPVPPPRTIADIKNALDQFKAPDPAKAEADRMAADAAIPAGLTGAKRVDALMIRAHAAGRLGRLKQQVEDLREAGRIVETEPYEDKAVVFNELAIAENLAGNIKISMELRAKAIAMIPQHRAGRAAPWNANLAVILANAGELDRARAQYAIAESALETQRRWRGWTQWGNVWTGAVLRAKGHLLDITGKHGEAEREYAEAVRLIEQHMASGVAEETAAGGGRVDLLRDAAIADRAMTLIRLGRTIDAEIEMRRAVANRLAAGGKYSLDTAWMLFRLAVAMTEQGRSDDAATLCRTTLEIYEKVGVTKSSVTAAATRALLARILANQGRWKAARAEFERIRSDLADAGDIYDKKYGADVDVALAELKAGDKARARQIATKAAEQTAARMHARHYKVAEANAVYAMTLAATL